MADEELEPMMHLRPGMTVKQAAALLAAAPPTWRVVGNADGTVAVGPSRKHEPEGT